MADNAVPTNSNTLLRWSLRSSLALVGVFLLAGFLARPAYASPQGDGLPPLPRACGGVNPPGYPVPICCMFGYVHYASATLTETQAAEGAVVTLTTQGGVVASTLTAPGWLNYEGTAYFQFNLDDAGVQSGDVVTLTSSYLDKQGQVVYQVAPGGQQVDVVLPETRGFDEITVIVDDQDTATGPDAPGFYIAGPAELASETTCGPGSEFWNGTLYRGTSTAGGIGPATISATYRPTLPVSGAYELFAYAPHGCAEGFMHYAVHIAGSQVVTTLVDQSAAGESRGQWISLGWFDFPAGTESYVTVNNHTGQPSQVTAGFDALKWEFRTPFPPIAAITVDDLDQALTPDADGFYKNDSPWWREATTGCDGSVVSGPIYWNGHIYWTYSTDTEPPTTSAQWRPGLPTSGVYDIYVFVPLCYATTHTARYRVYAGGELLDEVTLDQAPQGGVWVYVGSYDLPGGASSTLYLDDLTDIDEELLAFDAVRWVLRPRFPPVATVHSILPPTAVQGQDAVALYGSGMDTDGGGEGIVAYEWRSNLDGLLATSSTFTVAAGDLSAGTHVLTFRVQDDEGLWSEPVTTHLVVQPPGMEESWHFMLYFAGDNNLSTYLNEALNRLEGLLLLDEVTVTVLFDRPGGGVWRYLVQPDGGYTDGVNRWYLGEKNTGAPDTLADYILWAQEEYPADHYYLAIADHGRGIQGLAWDDTSDGDYLTLPELRVALQQGTDNGLLKIDVLHLDACLMSMIEVGYEIWPYADYLVASENLAWALFGYDRYVQALTPASTPRDLAVSVADIYHTRIAGFPDTISVLDLKQVSDLVGKVNALAGALLDALPGETVTLTHVLNQVQRFDSHDYGRIDGQDEFVDLRHLAELLAAMAGDETVRAMAREVFSSTSLSQAGVVTTTLVREYHASGAYGGVWWNLDNANGIAIYFPPSSNSWDYTGYVSPTLRLGQDTSWDELLAAYLGDPPLLPPEEPEPPSPPELWRVYLPLVLRVAHQ